MENQSPPIYIILCSSHPRRLSYFFSHAFEIQKTAFSRCCNPNFFRTKPPTTTLQTTISVQFKPVSSVNKYQLEWKNVEDVWTSGAVRNTTVSVESEGKPVAGEATDLDPGMTYCVRAYCLKSDGSKGSAGPELIVDTEQVGCTPKAEKSCCIIQ